MTTTRQLDSPGEASLTTTRRHHHLSTTTILHLLVIFATTGGDLLLGVGAQQLGPGHRQVPRRSGGGVPVRMVVPVPVSVSPACGTKFVDASSSALLAEVVLKGSVEELFQASPVTPLLYKAKVTVHKVYKGQGLLIATTTREPDNNNNNNSSSRRSSSSIANNNNNRSSSNSSSSSNNNNRNRKKTRVNVLLVERFGPTENRENCVGHVEKGQIYLFFLHPKEMSHASVGISLPSSSSLSSSVPSSSSSSSSLQRDRDSISPAGQSSYRAPLPPVLVNTALPAVADLKTLRKVKKVLCPDCSSVPVIKKLRCKHCAVKPSIKRPMSANETKTVKTGKRLALRCVARGSPKPTYTWVKDGVILYHQKKGEEEEEEEAKAEEEGEGDAERRRGRERRRRRRRQPFSSSERRRERRERHGGASVFKSGTLSVRSSRYHSLLVLNKVKPEDQGTYMCLAANPVGEVEQSVKVTVVQDARSKSRSTLPPAPDLELSTSSTATRNASQEDAKNPCTAALNSCYNGGICFVEMVAEDGDTEEAGRGRIGCDCPAEYHGSRCQFKRRRPVSLVEADGDSDDDDGGGGDDDDDDVVEDEGVIVVISNGDDGVQESEEGGHIQTTTLPHPVDTNNDDDDSNNDNNKNHHHHHNNNNNNTTITNHHQHHPNARRKPPPPTSPSPIIPSALTPTPHRVPPFLPPPRSLSPPSSPHRRGGALNPPLTSSSYLSKKHRQKYGLTSGGVRYGIGTHRKGSSRSGAPQLKVSECAPGVSYCLNGGKCKIVAKLQRKFCQCPRGFAGRQCEKRF